MGIRVGIDLGTTFSAVAYIDPISGKPQIIKNKDGKSVTPSVLCFEESGEVLFGEDAKLEQSVGNVNVASFFKRFMGNETFEIDFWGKSYTASDLSAILLKKLIEQAESQINEKVDSAVITIPAYFAHKERAATMEAAKKAGINLISIISEPTAAAFAYGLNEKDEEQTILIYDLGGGTFDVTVARINRDSIKVLGCDGNHELGGKEWDDAIARYLASSFEEKYSVDITDSQENINAILVEAESVKKKLTDVNQVTVPMNYGGIRGQISITLETFNSITEPLLNITTDISNRLLSSIGIDWTDITGVILVGGSTRMRMIHDFVKNMCGKEPLYGVNVDEAVALGAAIRANIDHEGNSLATLPAGRSVDESEEVILTVSGAKRFVDATAHSLGMIAESSDRERYINSTIIPKNSNIPVEKMREYSFKTRPSNNELEVYVLQGSCERPLDNTIIHKYVIRGMEHIQSKPSQIQISYKYTENCVVEVSAVQKENGKKLQVTAEEVPADMSWTDGCPKDNDPPVPELEVVIAVDLSGSMGGEPIKEAKRAMKTFVEKMDKQHTKIGILAFSDSVSVSSSVSKNQFSTYAAISSLTVGSTGYGNSAEPFSKAAEMVTGKSIRIKDSSEISEPPKKDLFAKISEKLAVNNNGTNSNGSELSEKKDRESIGGKGKKAKKEPEVVRYIIVLTDGMWSNSARAISASKAARAAGIEIIAIGFGSADYDFLKKIASSDNFASLTDMSNLTTSFSKIAQEISSK